MYLVLFLDGSDVEKYFPTQLGSAVLASALSPDEGLVVFAELQKARRNFVLENELHIIYQVGFYLFQTSTNIIVLSLITMCTSLYLDLVHIWLFLRVVLLEL